VMWDFYGSMGRGNVTVGTPTFSVEVITLPVSDVERALRFYVDQAGFKLDVDYAPSDTFRVVQLTPPGEGAFSGWGRGWAGGADINFQCLRSAKLSRVTMAGCQNRLDTTVKTIFTS
jgi:hypothetical protein